MIVNSITGKWVVLLGAPGCGKGTQSELLINSELKFQTISVGEILRKNKETIIPTLNKSVGDVIGSGILLPDDTVVELVSEELKKIDNVTQKNLIFDGFPRTVGQAEELSKMVLKFNKSITCAINFEIPDDLLIKRILGRFSCKNCGKLYNEYFGKPIKSGVCDVCNSTEFIKRSDDNEKSLSIRLAEYHNKTAPVIEFYRQRNCLKTINANLDIHEINRQILSFF